MKIPLLFVVFAAALAMLSQVNAFFRLARLPVPLPVPNGVPAWYMGQTPLNQPQFFPVNGFNGVNRLNAGNGFNGFNPPFTPLGPFTAIIPYTPFNQLNPVNPVNPFIPNNPVVVSPIV